MRIGLPPNAQRLLAPIIALGVVLGGCGATDSVAPPRDEEPETQGRHRVVALVGPGTVSSANDLNDGGWVVGSIGGVAALWVVDGEGAVTTVEVLGATDSSESNALAVNNSGQLVGWTRDGAVRPFVWTQASGLVELPLPGDLSSGVAFGLNDGGQIVGGGAPDTEYSPAAGGRALMWTVDRDATSIELTDLGSFGADGAAARAINVHGDLAGVTWQGASLSSFLRKGGELEHLPTGSEALAVNGEGKVAGAWSDQAVLWASGSIQTIGPVGSVARDLNDDDVIVGEVFGPAESGQGVGFLRTAEEIRFLEGLSTIDGTRAAGINASGFVVGESYVPTAGASEAVMWIPNRDPS